MVCGNEAQRLGYELLRGLSLNFAITHQVGNSTEISKVGENKQLVIAIVGNSYFLNTVCPSFMVSIT